MWQDVYGVLQPAVQSPCTFLQSSHPKLKASMEECIDYKKRQKSAAMSSSEPSALKGPTKESPLKALQRSKEAKSEEKKLKLRKNEDKNVDEAERSEHRENSKRMREPVADKYRQDKYKDREKGLNSEKADDREISSDHASAFDRTREEQRGKHSERPIEQRTVDNWRSELHLESARREISGRREREFYPQDKERGSEGERGVDKEEEVILEEDVPLAPTRKTATHQSVQRAPYLDDEEISLTSRGTCPTLTQRDIQISLSEDNVPIDSWLHTLLAAAKRAQVDHELKSLLHKHPRLLQPPNSEDDDMSTNFWDVQSKSKDLMSAILSAEAHAEDSEDLCVEILVKGVTRQVVKNEIEMALWLRNPSLQEKVLRRVERTCASAKSLAMTRVPERYALLIADEVRKPLSAVASHTAQCLEAASISSSLLNVEETLKLAAAGVPEQLAECLATDVPQDLSAPIDWCADGHMIAFRWARNGEIEDIPSLTLALNKAIILECSPSSKESEKWKALDFFEMDPNVRDAVLQILGSSELDTRVADCLLGRSTWDHCGPREIAAIGGSLASYFKGCLTTNQYEGLSLAITGRLLRAYESAAPVRRLSNYNAPEESGGASKEDSAYFSDSNLVYPPMLYGDWNLAMYGQGTGGQGMVYSECEQSLVEEIIMKSLAMEDAGFQYRQVKRLLRDRRPEVEDDADVALFLNLDRKLTEACEASKTTNKKDVKLSDAIMRYLKVTNEVAKYRQRGAVHEVEVASNVVNGQGHFKVERSAFSPKVKIYRAKNIVT